MERGNHALAPFLLILNHIIVKLKNFLWLLVAVLMSSALASCGDDEPEISVSTDFKIATEAIKALKSGGEYLIKVQSTIKPTFTSSEVWATIKSVESSGSLNQIWTAIVNVEANSQNDERVANVDVVAGSNQGRVTITQVAADGLYISSSEIPETVSQNGGTYKVVYLSNNDAQITSSASWVKVTSTGGRSSMTEKTISVAVEANKGSEREATVTIVAGDKTEVLNVKQDGYTSAGPDKTGMEKSAKEIAKSIVAGWNIGNTLEAIGGETAWGNPKITEKLIQSIKAAGFNAVRLPVAWDGYIEDASTYKIKDSWLDRVNEIVGWCVSNDMYVIVNIHWDGGWLENNCNVTGDAKAAIVAKQKALWTQIATKLAGYDEHLLFAGCNEPNVSTATEMSVLAEYEQAFVDAVRATSGKNYYRTLIIQGPSTDIDKTSSLFGSMPTDVVSDRLMAEVHYYSPWQFCGMEKSDETSNYRRAFFWGEGNYISGSDRNATWGKEDYMLDEFAKMKKKFVDNGYPVILGEFGAIKDWSNEISDATEKAAHKQSRYDFNMKVTREAKNYGMVPFMWDTGEGMNRTSGEVTSDVIIPAVIAGAAAGKYPY